MHMLHIGLALQRDHKNRDTEGWNGELDSATFLERVPAGAILKWCTQGTTITIKTKIQLTCLPQQRIYALVCGAAMQRSNGTGRNVTSCITRPRIRLVNFIGK